MRDDLPSLLIDLIEIDERLIAGLQEYNTLLESLKYFGLWERIIIYGLIGVVVLFIIWRNKYE